MKSLLISLMAFLCALGVNATPSGSGTKEDPYVIADGDTYVVNDIVYASFTAPADGTLSLKHGWSYPTFMLEDGTPLNVSMGVDANFSSLEVEAGKTYVIYNNRQLFFDLEIAVSFEEKGASSLQVVSSEPEQCTSLNLVAFKESFPYGVPCFLLMQKTSFHVAKGHVLQRESIPFALQKDVFCVAGLMLLPEPLWRHGHDNTIRHTIQRFFRQTGVSFCGLSARRARCA